LKTERGRAKVFETKGNAKEAGTMTRDIGMTDGESKSYIVRVRTTSSEFEGELFSPYPEKRLAEVLSRLEDFVNLKGACDLTTKEKYPFMVISKSHIETIKVIDER